VKAPLSKPAWTCSTVSSTTAHIFIFLRNEGARLAQCRSQQQAAAVDQYGSVHLVEPSSSQVVLRTSPLWPLEALNLEQRRPCDYSGLLPRLWASKEADRIERHNFSLPNKSTPETMAGIVDGNPATATVRACHRVLQSRKYAAAVHRDCQL
jgi:hypothetical protein